MLVLRRRRGQEIVIGDTDDIRVKVLSSDGQTVRLGIAAPKEVRVNRREVHERMQNVGIQIKCITSIGPKSTTKKGEAC